MTAAAIAALRERLEQPAQPANDWVPVTESLLGQQHPLHAKLYDPMWIAMKDGRVLQGHYEWRQGHKPDRFITDGGNKWVFDAAYVMPIVKPVPPEAKVAQEIDQPFPASPDPTDAELLRAFYDAYEEKWTKRGIELTPLEIARIGVRLAGVRQPLKTLTDEQQIAEALRRHGFTLVKKSTGFDVLKLSEIVAQDIKEQS